MWLDWIKIACNICGSTSRFSFFFSWWRLWKFHVPVLTEKKIRAYESVCYGRDTKEWRQFIVFFLRMTHPFLHRN